MEMLDKIMEGISSPLIRVCTYAEIAYILGKHGDPRHSRIKETALREWSELKGGQFKRAGLVIMKYFGMARFEEYRTVLEGLLEMARREGDSTLMRKVVDVAIEVGDVSSALGIMGYLPSPERAALGLKLVKRLVEMGDYGTAEEIAGHIPGRDERSRAFFTLLRAYIGENSAKDAFRMLENIESAPIRERALLLLAENTPPEMVGTLIEGARESGVYDEVVRRALYRVARAGEAGLLRGLLAALPPHLKDRLRAGLILALMERSPESVVTLLGEEPGEELIVKLLSGIAGNPMASYRRALPLIEPFCGSGKCKMAIITAYLRYGEVNEALRVLKGTREEPYRTMAIGRLVLSLLEEGDVEGAFRLAGEVRDEALRSWLLEKTAQAYAVRVLLSRAVHL
ncbi:hypothetical protein [Palaeococcus ferrophilus]|uniref:hypothetical protein n=1 Tax=Palaeococcus ferrophilus TaxID=83868 RepID=UPI00064F27B2|nr:hypothetical protein [Palaeococcus ferrophilus]